VRKTEEKIDKGYETNDTPQSAGSHWQSSVVSEFCIRRTAQARRGGWHFCVQENTHNKGIGIHMNGT
jgi:hypothetical protein